MTDKEKMDQIQEEELETLEAEAVEETVGVEETVEEDSSGKRIDELTNSMARLQADFQNYRKRMEKERKETIQYANEALILDLLEVVDNFERALLTEKEHDAFFNGMEMIHQQLLEVLTKNGLEEVLSDGESFDPNRHHAVLSEESDTVSAGHVIETMQKGYTLKGRVIRPAMVKVAK